MATDESQKSQGPPLWFLPCASLPTCTDFQPTTMPTALPSKWDYWRYVDDKLRDERHRNDELSYHDSNSNADYLLWAESAFWTADQATALTFGKTPEKINWDMLKGHAGWLTSPFANYYAAVRSRVLHAQEAKQLPDPIRPSLYFAWATLNGIDFPPSLEEAVSQHEQGLKAWLELERQKNQKFHDELERTIQELRLEREKTKALGSPVVKDLHPKERISAYTLIYGLARLHYHKEKYDPRVNGSRPIKQIVADLAKYNLNITDDTVRKWLDSAEQTLDAAALEDERDRQEKLEAGAREKLRKGAG